MACEVQTVIDRLSVIDLHSEFQPSIKVSPQCFTLCRVKPVKCSQALFHSEESQLVSAVLMKTMMMMMM